MKKIGLILAGCVAFIGLCGAHAEDIGGVVRAAGRRTPTVTSRQTTTNLRSNSNTQTPNVRNRTTATRATPPATRANGNVVSRTTSGTVSQRVPAKQTRSAQISTRSANRVTASQSNSTARKSRTVSRAASTNTVTREDVLTRDYSKCKTVFFECMDEFCANKDAQLKRCACSSRIHEFDNVKKQLAAVEDKMLDFNQRLLTVSMEKEDVAALSVATEGETAYLATKDTSDSKKALDSIAKKLNTSFDTSKFNTDQNVLSWSLNVDSAFDTVDSLLGASTTSKSGTALYSAALPVCREMAAEVCTDDDLALAESGYQVIVEQDCNTVAKTYKTQTDQARAKVLEGSALLDMSRLDIYQKRNADDFLTCKKKMLDMLTDSTVCGDELGKCLDVTGQYIDPSTGEAFLTPDLVNLGNLLKRPTEKYTWSTVPGNSTFVTYLNSKKKFLEPAMEQCQTIADDVWDSFIDDALSQIKLAQDQKLQTVRQSCTTLTAQCLSDATESITNFDARALSTFGISANITANAMCSNIINACTALLDTTGDGAEWVTGITDITTSITYETLMQTCRQVGQACIIQVCKSTSGNFGLCESISNSTNRKAIINHTACWDEVQDCIRRAGLENIDRIITQLNVDTGTDLNFYSTMYDSQSNFDENNVITDLADDKINACIIYNDGGGTESKPRESTCVFDLCAKECSTSSTLFDCRVCRLAENLWGNCEVPPVTPLEEKSTHNMIKTPRDTTNPTLLYWFATNTGTTTALDSCRDTTCGIGYAPTYNSTTGLVYCVDKSTMCFGRYNIADLDVCPESQITPVGSGRCQCCSATAGGNCCESGYSVTGDNFAQYCVGSSSATVVTQPYIGNDDKQHVLVCDGTMDTNTARCNGTLIDVVLDGANGAHYNSPTLSGYVTEQFMTDNGICTYASGTWQDTNSNPCATPTQWSVVFN